MSKFAPDFQKYNAFSSVRCVLLHFLVHRFSMPRDTVCVSGMCRRMPQRNYALNRPPYGLVNVAVKLDIDSSFGH